MDLAELIRTLKERGNQLTSWYGVETNVEAVGELEGSNETGQWKINLKLKQQ